MGQLEYTFGRRGQQGFGDQLGSQCQHSTGRYGPKHNIVFGFGLGKRHTNRPMHDYKVHNPEDKTWMMMMMSKLVKTVAMPMTTCLVIDDSSMIRSRRFVVVFFFSRLSMFASSSSSVNFGSMNVLKVAVWTRIVGKQQCSFWICCQFHGHQQQQQHQQQPHNPEAMAPSIVNNDLSRLGILVGCDPQEWHQLVKDQSGGYITGHETAGRFHRP